MIGLIRQLNTLFNSRDRTRLLLLSIALVIRAGLEVVGVASIMPFIGVVANPQIIYENEYLSRTYDIFGFETTTSFVMFLGVLVVVFLILANGFSALTVYATTRFSWGIHHRLSVRLIEGYLQQPYSFFVQHNSAELNKTLLNECQQVVQQLLLPLLNAVAKALVVFAISVLLFVMEPILAISIITVVGGAYATLYTAVKKKQREFGKERVLANQERFKVASEVFGGIKDVKVLQRETSFLNRFRSASVRFSQTTASNSLIAALPRYLFETIAFGGIVVIVLYYLSTGSSIENILPILSLYAFAGYRFMPEVQQLFAAVAQIRFNRAALDVLESDLRFSAQKLAQPDKDLLLEFEHDIVFENITFSYPEADRPTLDRVSLRISRNQTIGLVGISGSGKTTLVDLLLGLHDPNEGQILVDGVPLNRANIRSWRRRVGYVPQHIFLTDNTVEANIAFGVDPAEIDPVRLTNAARVANIHDFITTLPNGYQTIVGERGVRMSGGQRQRIGIARALYHDPDVLIMDEATSALDSATESALMDAIHALAGQKTIILIAHRLSTVRSADVICVVNEGRIDDVGNYEDLLQGSSTFRLMAEAHSG